MNANIHSRDGVLEWLALALVPGVSPGAQRKLLETLGSPRAIAGAAGATIATIAGSPAAEALASGPDPSLVERSLEWLDGTGCHLVAMGDPDYPRALLHIADPPVVLYARGRVELLNSNAFAIVGSRNATALGVRDAEAIGCALSNAGLTIVSGLALGVDAAAHRGGLAGAASSVAVMGTGPDLLYPRRNRDLALRIAAEGCLVTEFPVGTPSAAGNFPRRNRLISGLSCGVLVVEAALESGSLITAKCALEQGRDVFAVPGSIHSTLSKGCHWLIKEGAKLVESADDVLDELGIQMASASRENASEEPECDPLLKIMGHAPMSFDEFAMHTGLGAATLAARLTRLELDGHIEALPGGRFQRVRP